MKGIRFFLAGLLLLFPITTGIFTDISKAENDEMLGGLKKQGLSAQITEVNPQWVEWTMDDRSATYDRFFEFGGDWVVPNPPLDGNLVFVGMDLEEYSTVKPRAIAAVLWWGLSSAGGGNYWSFAAWWVEWVGPGQWDYDTLGLGNVVENVARTGDVMHAEMWREEGNPSNWIVQVWDTTRQTRGEGSNAQWIDATPYTLSSVNLQIPNFGSAPSAKKLPSTIYFSNLYLSIQGYEPVTPIWIGGQNYYGYGLQVTHDSTWVTLHINPTVGGVVISVDKLALLAPYIGLTSTIIAATVATAIYAKRFKRREEKR